MNNGWGSMHAARGLAFAGAALVALAGCPPPACDRCDAGDVVSVDVRRDAAPGPDVEDVTVDAAVDAADVQAMCAPLDGQYVYGYEGGNGVSSDQSALAPADAYTRRRTFADGTTAPIECSVPIPECLTFDGDAGDAIRVDDVLAAVDDPDVQRALTMTADDAGSLVVYGVDTRPVDGQVFAFRTADGRGFFVGDPCDGTPGCRDVPDGLAVLEGLLAALDRQQLADPTCAMLR